MGYALLWIGCLTSLILLIALVNACIARWPWGIFAHLVLSLVWLYLLMGSTVVTGFWWILIHEQHADWAWKWFVATGLLTVSYAVASIGLWLCGRRKVDGTTMRAASQWPRAKLAASFLGVVAVTCLTVWLMDRAACRQADSLRTEIDALVSSAAPPVVVDGENAAVLYAKAAESIDVDAEWAKPFLNWTKQRESRFGLSEPPSAELKESLEHWGETIRLLHEAAGKPGCWFAKDYHQPIYAIRLSDLYGLLNGGDILALDCWNKASAGDWRGAMQDVRTGLLMAKHARTVPLFWAHRVAEAIEDRAIASLQVLLAARQIDPAELAGLPIEEQQSSQPFLHMMQLEEATMLITFYQLAHDELGLAKLMYLTKYPSRFDSSPEASPVSDFLFSIAYSLFMLDDDLVHTRWLFHDIEGLATMPYPEAAGVEKRYDALHLHQLGFLTRWLMPTVGAEHAVLVRTEARHRTARLGIAAYCYREKNGRWPEKPDKLVPEFLASLPVDPFDGQPMRWQRTETGLKIYSIGCNLEDEGGTPPNSSSVQSGDVVFELSN